METKNILDNIHQRLGIGQLNVMQQTMATTPAREIALLAPTGTGKTIAFTIRMLRSVHHREGVVSAVVIAPSRELVLQIQEVVRPVAAGLKCVAFYGGHSMVDEANSLAVTPDIIIATPGRLLDHVTRSQVNLSAVTTLVLDEYDKSLELGFYDEMSRLIKRMSRLSTVVLTSATRIERMPEFLKLDSLETFDYTTVAGTPKEHMQFVRIDSPERDKINILAALLRSLPNQKVIVFVNHRESAERVYSMLLKEGFPVSLYHGGLEQRERKLAVDMLDNGSTPILVSTDLGSRGLDIDDVGSVIHYHLPPTAENWTHRNGRTARMGASGTVYSIIADGENIPGYVTWDREYMPGSLSPEPIRSDTATIYFNAGKKEKISRGDIAGFLIQKGGLAPDEVGRIVVDDHSAIAAVPRDKAQSVVAAVAPHRLKNQRVRVSVIGRVV